MITSTHAGTTTALDVKVSIPCEIFSVPATVLNNLRFIDPRKITSGVIEIATSKFREHLFLLKATVEDSKIKGISITDTGTCILCHEDPFWKPVISEAWKQEGIDIDKLDTSAVDVEAFIKDLQKLLVHESKKQDEAKRAWCVIEIRVFDLHDFGILVCAYICHHWVECVLLGPEPKRY